MNPEIKEIFEKYMLIRFPGPKHLYIKDWEKRFEDGMEWQKSDYEGRAILQEIAPHIYPEHRANFFVRKDNKTTIIIDVEDGLIQEIHNKPDDIEIIVRDYDVEGVEEDRIKIDEGKREYIEIGF